MYNVMFRNILPGDIGFEPKFKQLRTNKTKYEIYPGVSVHIPINVTDINGKLTNGIVTVISVYF